MTSNDSFYRAFNDNVTLLLEYTDARDAFALETVRTSQCQLLREPADSQRCEVTNRLYLHHATELLSRIIKEDEPK